MQSLQNYAKFESRISQDEFWWANQYSQNITWNYWYQDDFINYSYYSLTKLIINLVDYIFYSILIVLFILIFFLIIYIFLSIISKWWKETAQELKQLANFLFIKFNLLLTIIFEKIYQIFLFFYKKFFLTIIIFIVFLAFIIILNISNWTSKFVKIIKIEPWYIWIDLKNKQTIGPWYHIFFPLITQYFITTSNIFNFEIVEVTANTKEDMSVSLDYKVEFKILSDDIINFYSTFWTKTIQQVSSDIVMPRVLEKVKWIIRQYSFREISSKHDEIKKLTLDETNDILKKIWVELKDINVIDIRLPSSYLTSIEKLEKADIEKKLSQVEYEKQTLENESQIKKAENEKQIKIIQAEWIAKSNEIINQSINNLQTQNINDKYLELKRIENEKIKIEKWDWKLPSIVLTKEQIDFIK